jgi:hypothetical protein
MADLVLFVLGWLISVDSFATDSIVTIDFNLLELIRLLVPVS